MNGSEATKLTPVTWWRQHGECSSSRLHS